MTATTHARTPSVGILGCGLMGAGIAEVCARAGADVTIVENDEPAATAGRRRVEKSLDRAVASGKLTEADRTVAWSRLQFGTDWDAFADRQLVIEAIPEIADVKVEAFRRIDAIVSSSESILASNTSSIPIMRLAVATQRNDPRTFWGCISSTPYQCCRWWNWSRHCSPPTAPRRQPNDSPARCSARRLFTPRIVPASSSTRSSFPTCSQPSACSNRGLPQRTA